MSRLIPRLPAGGTGEKSGIGKSTIGKISKLYWRSTTNTFAHDNARSVFYGGY